MKAVIYRGVGDVAPETVPDPKIQQPTGHSKKETKNEILFCEPG